MAELLLPHDQILNLRADAHRLAPVVLMGAGGLSAAVLKEIDRALAAHGLIKVRASKNEREQREAMYLAIAEQLAAARIQCIGNTFVLFRPIPPAAPAPARAKKSAAKRPSAAAARRPAAKAAKAWIKKGPSPLATRRGAKLAQRSRSPAGGNRQR